MSWLAPALLTALGGVGISFGLWLYARFKPLKLQILQDAEDPVL